VSEKKKRLLFQFSFVLVACLLIEIVLRFMGYQPGDMKPNWLNFHPVDSLVVEHSFYVNQYGLVVADPKDKQHFFHVNPKINSDGFRSPEFSEQDSTKKKILFIGDSFTWGFSAEPVWDSCFTDRIRNETEYEVYNTGIPTADPPQYAEIARRYIPQLKPDIVFVMFFMGNDLMKKDRRIIPDSSFFYFTNSGCIEADIDGHYFTTAQAAYDYVTEEKYYLGKSNDVFEIIVSKSSLLSRLYSIRFRVEEKIDYENLRKNTVITKKYLSAIKQVCKENRVNFKFVFIAEIKEADMKVEELKEKYADLLLDAELKDDWLIPQCKKQYFKPYPDSHLNNEGHRFYANYLKDYLKNKSVEE
jgi:lysophospholipase L1-like esterase